MKANGKKDWEKKNKKIKNERNVGNFMEEQREYQDKLSKSIKNIKGN